MSTPVAKLNQSNSLIEKKEKRKNFSIAPLLFILPAIVPLLIFWVYPMGKSLLISFTDWDYVSPEYEFIGFSYYTDLLTDPTFYSVLLNTFVFSMGVVIPCVAGGLLLALLVSGKSKGIAEGFLLNDYQKDRVFNSEARWYKGDFHTHTTESDGKMTPEKGMEQARIMNLDFFVATDHNILPTKWLDDEIMVIPGVEITSSKGHFNALGLTKWINWRPSCEDGGMETEEGMNRIIREVKTADAIVSINHPMLQPWEWQYRQTQLADIDVVEIWNDLLDKGEFS